MMPAPSQPSRTPRVACVSLDPAGGGGMAEVMRSLLASPLASRYRMRMVITHAAVSSPRRLVLFAASLAELAAWCLGRGRRVVHVHGAVRGSLYRKSVCVFLARALRRPVLFQIHAGPGDIEDFAARLGGFRTYLFGEALRRASLTVAVSSASARALERCFDVPTVGVLPNPAPAIGGEGGDVGESGRSRVLYLGGFADPAKGGDVLVEALEAVAADCPDAEFALFGPGDPPRRLSALSSRLQNVSWGGWLDGREKEREFSSASVFVLPSISEGLPVALLEAMAWGRAIVATAMGGVLDLVRDGKEGLLVPPGDARALAAALRRVLDDPELRRVIAAEAKARSDEFSEAEVWGRLGAIYEELAA